MSMNDLQGLRVRKSSCSHRDKPSKRCAECRVQTNTCDNCNRSFKYMGVVKPAYCSHHCMITD